MLRCLFVSKKASGFVDFDFNKDSIPVILTNLVNKCFAPDKKLEPFVPVELGEPIEPIEPVVVEAVVAAAFRPLCFFFHKSTLVLTLKARKPR